MSAEWRHLALLNYEIEPSVLEPLIPFGCELDFRDGRTFVSLVAFMFYNTKMFGVLPALGYRDFEEVNLRFYVTRKTDGEVRRGVVFVKEVVPKRLLAFTARVFYGENYVRMPMSHEIDEGRAYTYRWGKNAMVVKTENVLFEASENGLERWISEHYWGYTRLSLRHSYEYEVRHPKWKLFPVKDSTVDVDVEGVYGPRFKSALSRRPASVFLADGSPVTVHFPSEIR